MGDVNYSLKRSSDLAKRATETQRMPPRLDLRDDGTLAAGPGGSLFSRHRLSEHSPQELPALAPLEVRRREWIQRRALAAADLASAVLATLIAFVVLGDEIPTALVLLMPPLMVLAAKLVGLYERDELVLRKSTLEDAPKLFNVVTLYALGVWLLEDFIVIGGDLGHRQIIGLWASLFAISLLGRGAARFATRKFVSRERCVVMGSKRVANELRERLAQDSGSNAVVVDVVPLEGRRAGDLGWRPPDMHMLCRELGVHRLIIAPDQVDSEHVLDAIRAAKSIGVRVSLFPRMLEVVGSSVEFEDVHGVPILGVRPFGLSRSSRALKRVFDVVGTSAGLLVLFPFLALIAAAIKLDSRGPIFYRQWRIGLNDRRFEILKFRTMVVDADQQKPDLVDENEAADGFFKITDDPRVTRVGRILRRTSVDELPQLYNVLRGDMSLVGPRPLIGEEDLKIEGWDRQRLDLTPGMTGHWQVLGSSRISLPEMVKIDYLYAVNWSLWSDVKLLLRTAPVVLGRKGR